MRRDAAPKRPPASGSGTARSRPGATQRSCSSRSTATASTPYGSTARVWSPAWRASPSWAFPMARSVTSCATTSARVHSPSSVRVGGRSCAQASWTTASGSLRVHRSPLPDAALLFCDRLIAFDHDQRRVHLLALADATGAAAAEAWLSAMERALEELAPPGPSTAPAPGTLSFAAREGRDAYLANIATCKHEIFEGETYEVCLTTQLHSDGAIDPLAAYRALRARNPAPHAALLRLGELSVLSSSPERFLRVDRGRVVESRPIKGTDARAADPAEDMWRAAALREDEKSRAENLMIVDLVRNDLGRVCALGTVEVPALMAVESYATVHQLVTTVRGRLRGDATAIDCIRATFPGGSMTGAPKLRTMEIIDRL